MLYTWLFHYCGLISTEVLIGSKVPRICAYVCGISLWQLSELNFMCHVCNVSFSSIPLVSLLGLPAESCAFRCYCK